MSKQGRRKHRKRRFGAVVMTGSIQYPEQLTQPHVRVTNSIQGCSVLSHR